MTSVKLVDTVLLSKLTLSESSTTIPSLIGALIQFPLPTGTSIQATSAETKSIDSCTFGSALVIDMVVNNF